MAFKIKIDKEACIGCGLCAGTCDNFEIGDDGKASVKQGKVEEEGCNKDAAEQCPVKCIKVIEA